MKEFSFKILDILSVSWLVQFFVVIGIFMVMCFAVGILLITGEGINFNWTGPIISPLTLLSYSILTIASLIWAKHKRTKVYSAP